MRWIEGIGATDLLQPFSAATAAGQNLSVVTGLTFENMREDWDCAWWNLVMSANGDTPSTVHHRRIPFEQRKRYLSPPFLSRSHALVAPYGVDPMGAVHLDEINLCCTGIAPTRRKQGVSTALKLHTFDLAKRLEAHAIGTFNRHKNPILRLNHTLGFVTKGTLLTYIKVL